MILNSLIATVFIYASLGIILFSISWFILAANARNRKQKIREKCMTILENICVSDSEDLAANTGTISFIRSHSWHFLDTMAKLYDTVVLEKKQIYRLAAVLQKCRLSGMLQKQLYARDVYRASRAAIYLSLFPEVTAIPALLSALERQHISAVRLLIVSSLCSFGKSGVVPSIIDSLKDSQEYYQNAVHGILSEFEGGIEELYPVLVQRDQKEIQLLLINLAGKNCPAILQNYLERLVDSDDHDIVHNAFRVLSKIKTESAEFKKYLKHDDFLIRNLAAESLGSIPYTESLKILFDHMDDPVIRKSACLGITELIHSRSEFLKMVMVRFLNESRIQARLVLADVLTNFVDYLMGKVIREDSEIVHKIFLELINHNKTKEIINFANRNADADIEKQLIRLFSRVIITRPDICEECRIFLNEELQIKLGIAAEKAVQSRPKRKEQHNLPLLFVFLFFAAVAPSLGCALAALSYDPATMEEFFYEFCSAFNLIFAIYAAALSEIYILLLVFSIKGVRNQARRHELITSSFLFRENVLPSISIISPAYNEEATIVESVNALFNLNYPDYEIIVINDGSSDNTVSKLIKAFDLERREVFIHNYIETQEIKAVYASRQYPELLVVDKVNGGKADSLNAGINIARKEYFSGIDADSLLEQDALLNLTSHFIFSSYKITAAGGNIFPANGCTVNKGTLTELRIPSKHIGRIQTLEYIRSFMAGRVGWSEIRLLLIISGAFGVFHRRTVINAGGYLTQNTRYKKDTVGEDMELVVRLSRTMKENKSPFEMAYAYNANCWTEVPEKFRILASQRDRWQRGLLDILSYHWRMMFNPKYGRVGLIGFPYFLLFEVIGPWIEVQGFIVFIASLILGWASRSSAAVILMGTIGLGMCVSLISMTISEYSRKYFPLRDKLTLLFYSFIENFGIRQVLNFLRVRGLVRMITKAEGWGKMERTGWNRGNQPQRSNV